MIVNETKTKWVVHSPDLLKFRDKSGHVLELSKKIYSKSDIQTLLNIGIPEYLNQMDSWLTLNFTQFFKIKEGN